jgi:hypothetical protein
LVDAGIRREVRAVGFRGDAFERVLGGNRHVWMNEESLPAEEKRPTVSVGGCAMSEKTYEELLADVMRLQDQGQVPLHPTRDQRIDWAYGNTKIENADITRDMAERAVDSKASSH